jgi:hypothetical protein
MLRVLKWWSLYTGRPLVEAPVIGEMEVLNAS